ncbi:MAG: hypothetical protein ACXAD7_26800, partial [Candidatus Kariarchaeaceae archaeon]
MDQEEIKKQIIDYLFSCDEEYKEEFGSWPEEHEMIEEYCGIVARIQDQELLKKIGNAKYLNGHIRYRALLNIKDESFIINCIQDNLQVDDDKTSPLIIHESNKLLLPIDPYEPIKQSQDMIKQLYLIISQFIDKPKDPAKGHLAKRLSLYHKSLLLPKIIHSIKDKEFLQKIILRELDPTYTDEPYLQVIDAAVKFRRIAYERLEQLEMSDLQWDELYNKCKQIMEIDNKYVINEFDQLSVELDNERKEQFQEVINKFVKNEIDISDKPNLIIHQPSIICMYFTRTPLVKRYFEDNSDDDE